MEGARAITMAHAKELARMFPTEWARQAAMRDNLVEPYAKHRDLVEALFIGDQHGFCMSAAGKTAPSHGGESDNNHQQYNYLEFFAPEYIVQQLAADPKYDVGIWACEDGMVFTRLRPRLRLYFNSKRTHQCLPSRTLLPFACDVRHLRVEAEKFQSHRETEVLVAVRAQPELMRSFRYEVDAAAFHSSLGGATTFQQQSVTNQLLRALVAKREESVLRGFQPGKPHVHMRPESAPLKKPSAAERKAMDARDRRRICALKAGQRIGVGWHESGMYEEGVVVEPWTPELVKSARDMRVLVRYGERALFEYLGFREWRCLD